jgi:hypothetical protein
MNELSKYLTEQILLEETTELTNFVVVYSGRFQPFHKGHYAAYQNLVKKFGKDRVYIGTSNKTDNQKSPFNFKEKKIIMTKMFGIPSNKIVEIKNPYAPIEILKKYDENTTGYITVVGEKDANRLGGKYFEKYTGKIEQGYKDKGYVYIDPAQSNPISGTDVRKWLGSGETEEQKKLFIKVYPKFDEKIFKLITLKLSKLNENMPGGVGIGLSFPNGTINGAPKPEDVKKMRKKLDAEDEDLTEEIKLDVNIGDTVLMGKFKNKKTVVKSIGKDEHGMPTINGKKVATFRILPKVNIFKETNEHKTVVTEEVDDFINDLLSVLDYVETHESRIPQNFNTAASDYHSIAPIKNRKYDKANFNTKDSGQPDVEDEGGEEIDEVGIGTGQSGIRPEYPKNDKLSDRMKVVSKARTHTDSDEDYQYEPIFEMAQSDLDAIEKYADSQLSPEDIELGKETDHFFQRLNDPRNGKPISPAELTGFFKRLAKNKKKFIEFVKQYKEFVVKDSKSNINIAFMKAANKLIAKTVMRKSDFKTTSPIFKTEVKEAFTKGQIFAGKMKVGGKPVNVEVELVGADNKTKEFITRIIYADKGYERQLPIGSTLPIPARIFRTPGGGWRRIKTPSVFESINESAVDIVNIFIMIAQMTFVGVSIKTALDDKGIGPIDAIKKWWNEIKTDRAIKSISNKIKTDPDIIEFLKLSPSQQRGKFRALVASKLSGDELRYLNKINKSNLS